MRENCPSATALRVAMRRAAHQVLDDPKIFDAPLALRVLGMENVSTPQTDQKPANVLVDHGIHLRIALNPGEPLFQT